MRQTNDLVLAPSLALAMGALLLSLAAPVAHAGEQTLDPASERCPSIFGTKNVRERNQERREARLHEVKSRQGKIELVHSVPKWDAPTQTSLPGMRVLGVESGGVRIHVDNRYGTACPEGNYLLRVDDALGANGRVLAVLPTSFLIERDQALAYLTPETRRAAPNFRMVWRSNFVWVAQQSNKGGGATAATQTRSAPLTKATTREERKKRNEDARRRARERREKAKNNPQSVIDSLPTTRLAKELRGGAPSPPPKKK